MGQGVQPASREVNLLDRYPRVSRPVEERGRRVTAEQRAVAREFGREYFDGDRLNGYGGYSYHPRFWQATVRRMRDYYRLREDSTVLDVGCAKGFMLHDFVELMPGLGIAGLDISEYAIQHAIDTVRPRLCVGNASALPFGDRSFDLVVSINTVHNLEKTSCVQALREIQRVSRRYAFVTVDAWRSEEERARLMKWNLTALTYMHADDWRRLLTEAGYAGDYYWFVA